MDQPKILPLNVLAEESSKPEHTQPGRKPSWLKVKLPAGPNYAKLRATIDEHKLHTVCESAKCPNMGECWGRGTATMMILGDVCTRSCGFCHIKTGRPPVYDLDEPRRVGNAVKLMGLKHIVLTSVNRDELPDGGSMIWAEVIREIHEQSPGTNVEVLIPDFCGNWDALQNVLDAKPEILSHNVETVPELYHVVRPQAKFLRSLELLQRAKQQGFVTKTGVMVGIGETDELLYAAFQEIRKYDVDILTIGQYLQPTREHLPISRWISPEQFAEYKRHCLEDLKFGFVISGALVRSSYHAEEAAESRFIAQAMKANAAKGSCGV